jgi:hypothetical protein
VADSMALRMYLRRVHNRLIADHRSYIRAEGYCYLTCG